MLQLSRLSLRALLALTLIAASACDLFTGTDRPNLRLTGPGTAVLRGFPIMVSVENRSNRSWFASSYCNVGIERLVDGEWVSAYRETCLDIQNAGSTASLRELSYAVPEIPAGETVALYWNIPADASLGTHRVRLVVTSDSYASDEVYHFFSPQFQVAEVVGFLK